MEALTTLFLTSLLQVWVTFTHNWPFLVVSVLIAVLLKLYLDPAKVSAFLIRYKRAGVVGATAAAVTTPLCSCGTMAIILGMMANMMPWAPIVAFMVASPLTSPEELIYSAGLFGWPFAVAFFVSSILLGLLGGLAAEIAESRGWLANQARMAPLMERPTAKSASDIRPTLVQAPTACACSTTQEPLAAPRPVLNNFRLKRQEAMLSINAGTSGSTACCGAGELSLNLAPALPVLVNAAPSDTCGCTAPAPKLAPASACGCGAVEGGDASSRPTAVARSRVTWSVFLKECAEAGRRLLVMFLGFAFIGYFLNGLIPSAWVAALFGSGNVYSVPLAATLGLPLYINTEGSLPLVRALIDGGMSQGAALAFLITGAGTSIGAIAGALTIARWRVIALVIGVLWVGAVAAGYLYNLALATGLF